MRMRIDSCFHPKQEQFRRSKARFRNFIAGTRSGKTYAAARVFYENICREIQIHKDAFLHYWVVSPDYPLGKVAMREVFEAIPAFHRKKWLQSSKELYLHPNVLIEFKSGENPERLVGVKLRGAWIDEAARCRRAVWVYVRQRLTDYSGWCLFSTTPMGRNWYYEEIYRRGDPSDSLYDPAYFNMHCKSIDNPHIPAEEIEAARRQLPPRYFLRDYEASLDAFHGQVYDGFDRTIHLFDEESPLPTFERIEAGLDFGFTNPACLLVGGITHDDSIYIVHETYQSGLLTDQLVEIVVEQFQKWGISLVHADPEDASSIAQLRQAGLAVVGARKEVLVGIRQVATVLNVNPLTGKPRLYFSAACRNLINEISTYRWMENRDGRTAEKPAPQQDDHACDALRYLVMGVLTRTPTFDCIQQPYQAGDIFL